MISAQHRAKLREGGNASCERQGYYTQVLRRRDSERGARRIGAFREGGAEKAGRGADALWTLTPDKISLTLRGGGGAEEREEER